MSSCDPVVIPESSVMRGRHPGRLKQTPTSVALIVGDAAIDWYEEQFERTEINPSESPRSVLNLQLRGGWKWHELPGGAFLLDRMFYRALDRDSGSAIPYSRVISPLGERDPTRSQLPREAIDGPGRNGRSDRNGMVHSLSVVGRYRAGQQEAAWRVTRYLGFSIDDPGWMPGSGKSLEPTVIDFQRRPVFSPLARPVVVLIDDAGNGFRHARSSIAWKAIEAAAHYTPTLILKLGQPLPHTTDLKHEDLWSFLGNLRRKFHKRAVLLAADDLRRENVDISHRLSWDRTLEDVMRELANSDSLLAKLARFGDIIIRFGLDGAVVIRESSPLRGTRLDLICDPARIEGDTERDIWAIYDPSRPTFVSGTQAAFAVALTIHLLKHVSSWPIIEAVTAGLSAAERLYHRGLIAVSESRSKPPLFDYDYTVFDTQSPGVSLVGLDSKSRFLSYGVDLRISNMKPTRKTLARFPQINLLRASHPDLLQLAKGYVREGIAAFARVPTLRVGELVTADRSEIESYRSIANLIDNHVTRSRRTRPLSIAVFGPPGAGKTFGITQIAKAIGGEHVEIIEVNVAQFTDHRDLIGAFHLARDKVIMGKIPLVFFDEFDTSLNGAPFGWLKYFLAPMQDARFNDGSRLHAIDRAMFVFAGGSRKSYRAFSDPKARENRKQDLAAEKRPDFASRLHGYIDIRGPNPTSPRDDVTYIIRRAIILRQKLLAYGPGLFKERGGGGILSIAEPVLDAFLGVPHYRHGARSIEALILMSGITPAIEYFEQTMVPHREQLDLHVDGATFERLLGSK
jgi:ATPase family associated with various cellular activities (AAA)